MINCTSYTCLISSNSRRLENICTVQTVPYTVYDILYTSHYGPSYGPLLLVPDQNFGDPSRSAITRDIYLCVKMIFTVSSSAILRLIKSTVQEISEQLWPQGVPQVNCYYLYSEKSNQNQDIRDPNIKQVRVFLDIGNLRRFWHGPSGWGFHTDDKMAHLMLSLYHIGCKNSHIGYMAIFAGYFCSPLFATKLIHNNSAS